jgi:hypothetical protein
MRLRAAGFLILLVLVPLPVICASDSPATSKFLRDYVGALRLTRAGDALLTTGGCDSAREQYAQARNLIEPYRTGPDGVNDSEMKQTAMLIMSALDARGAECSAKSSGDGAGPLTQSAVRASWALVSFEPNSGGTRVGYRDLHRAIHELEATFGPVKSGPQAGQDDLRTAAATLAYFLAHAPQTYPNAWEGYVAPPWGRRP